MDLPGKVHLDGILCLQYVHHITQFGVTDKLAEGALNPTVCITDKDVKQNYLSGSIVYLILFFLGWIFSFLLHFTRERTALLKNLVSRTMKDVYGLQINHSLKHFSYCSEIFVGAYKTLSSLCKNHYAYLLHYARVNELVCAGLVQCPGTLRTVSRVMCISCIYLLIYRSNSGIQHLFLAGIRTTKD